MFGSGHIKYSWSRYFLWLMKNAIVREVIRIINRKISVELNVKQAQQNTSSRRPISIQMGNRLREGILLISVAVALFLLLAFLTYHNSDPSGSNTGVNDKVLNWGGRLGAFLADLFLSIFGCIAYILPPMIVFAAWLGVKEKSED